MSQLVTFSIFKFDQFNTKYWAFSRMQFAHQKLKNLEGQSFYKLMGSGKQGFKPWPDFSTYALLQVWDSIEDAEHSINQSEILNGYYTKAFQTKIYFLKAFQSRGQWNKKKVFKTTANLPAEDEEIVSLTRASIRKRKLLKFWKTVSLAHATLDTQKNLIFAKGFGEYPFIEMATFSHWKSHEDMLNYAYKEKEHQKAIKTTKVCDLFREELFASFKILKLKQF